MTGAAPRRPSVDSVGILLPASWWTIDLRDTTTRTRSIAALVEQQVGRADIQASLRAELRAELGRAAEQAAAAGGRLMAVSLMQADGFPLSATLTAYRVPGTDLTGAGLAQLEEVLRTDEGVASHGSPADGSGEQTGTVELAEGPGGPVLRRVRHKQGSADLGAERLRMLVVDYWLDPEDRQGLLLLTFSTPLVDAQDGWLELFDVIVASTGTGQGDAETVEAPADA